MATVMMKHTPKYVHFQVPSDNSSNNTVLSDSLFVVVVVVVVFTSLR